MKENSPTSRYFKIGGGLLLVLILSNIANSTYLVFFDQSWIDGHIAWLFMTIYAFVVVLFPYRRLEKWAWYLTWSFGVTFIIFGLNHINEPMFGPGYIGDGNCPDVDLVFIPD
jgi:hypothetical protein